MSHTHTIPSSSEYHNPHLNQYEHHNQHSIPPHTRGHADASSPSASSPHPYQQWSPLLRDRQARGKDPYASFADNDDDDDDGYYYNNNNQSGQSHPRLSARAGGAADQDLLRPRQTNFRHGQGLSSRDSYEDRERKEFAMSVLDNPDLLLMHALGNNDSLAGQRLRFLTMMCPVEQERLEAEAEAEAGRRGSGYGLDGAASYSKRDGRKDSGGVGGSGGGRGRRRDGGSA